MRLDLVLERTATKYPYKTSFSVCGDRSISFAQLSERSDAAADALRNLGIRRGDRIGILSGHDVDAIILFWGILKISGVVVWLNEEAGIDSLAEVVKNAEARYIFVQTEHDKEQVARAGQPDGCCMLLSELLVPRGSEIRSRPVAKQAADATDTALIVYTSGSSGRPKGVCLSHRNLWTVAQSVVDHMHITDCDSYLMVVPLHYVHGIMQLLVHVLAGATVYCSTSFIFPGAIVKLLRKHAITGFSGVPYHFNALIGRGGLLSADLPDMRWLTVTGGKLAASRIVEIVDSMPNINFHIAYGQTECAPRATALDPDKIRQKPDSVGSAIPRVTVMLIDDDGNEVPRGSVGEVVVAGPNVMQGYWRDPDGTADVVDLLGRLHTGDLGYFDQDGDLFLVGRISAMIKSAGERIFPEELERILTSHEFIDEAVVVGIADELYGQRTVAHLSFAERCKDKAPEQVIETVREYCLSKVPLARAPREYFCWHEFPKKSNGKPDRLRISEGQTGDEFRQIE